MTADKKSGVEDEEGFGYDLPCLSDCEGVPVFTCATNEPE